jgi:dephospho-CoA kinase
MLTVVVTGDVGAGKSTLVKIWDSLGATVISADMTAKSQWSKPEVMSEAVARWGSEVSKGGAADFSAIARRAFENEEEYRFMNSLIHPGTAADIRRVSASLRGLVVIEIPLFFEAGGLGDLADYIVYVSAPRNIRAQRNAARGWDEDEIARRERFMMEAEEKKKKSNLVLSNDGDAKRWETVSRERGEKLMAMASAYELVTCCATFEDAREISSMLVEGHLVACVNISEVKSCYFWKDRVWNEPEWQMSCKTTARCLKAAMECIREHHAYELPAITATELSRSDPQTLEWIAESCKWES